MKTSNRYTVDIEIPRLFVTLDIKADNWIDALTKAATIKPLEYIAFKRGSSCMDHSTPRISSVYHQD